MGYDDARLAPLSLTRLQCRLSALAIIHCLSRSRSLPVEAPATGKKAQAPSFTQKPSIQQLESSVIFICGCTAVPQPTVTWYKETTVVKESSRHRITIKQEGESYILSLEILVSTTLCRHLSIYATNHCIISVFFSPNIPLTTTYYHCSAFHSLDYRLFFIRFQKIYIGRIYFTFGCIVIEFLPEFLLSLLFLQE